MPPLIIVAALTPHRRPNQGDQRIRGNVSRLGRQRPRPNEQFVHIRPRLHQHKQNVKHHGAQRQHAKQAVRTIRTAQPEKPGQRFHSCRSDQRNHDRHHRDQPGNLRTPQGVNRNLGQRPAPLLARLFRRGGGGPDQAERAARSRHADRTARPDKAAAVASPRSDPAATAAQGPGKSKGQGVRWRG